MLVQMYQSEKLKYWSLTKRDENRHENRHSERDITANAVILCGITRTEKTSGGREVAGSSPVIPTEKEPNWLIFR